MDMLRDIAEARTVTVSRDGKETEVYMPEISLLDIARMIRCCYGVSS